MMKSFLSAMLIAVTMCFGARADALVWRVYYNHSGCPPAFNYTDVERAISQVLREFETAPVDGNVIARYEGPTSESHFQGGYRIVITWRPLTNQYARTCVEDWVHCEGGGLGPREIQLTNALRWTNANGVSVPMLDPRWTPPLGQSLITRGRSLQSTLIHEFAHNFRDIRRDDGDSASGDHPNRSSVLSYTIPDIAGQHLWNDDSNPVNNRTNSGSYAIPPINPDDMPPWPLFTTNRRRYPTSYGPHLAGIRVQRQSSSTHQILSSEDLSNVRPHTPVAITMADGQLASTSVGQLRRNFGLVWGDRTSSSGIPVANVVVSQHDGAQAFWTQTVGGTFGTMRRPCIAVQAQHQVVVFTGVPQGAVRFEGRGPRGGFDLIG
jgi:hypothetical protein